MKLKNALLPFLALALFTTSVLTGQTDPGVRTASGAAGTTTSPTVASPVAGTAANSPAPFPSISANVLSFFNDGLSRFQNVETVLGIPSGPNKGSNAGLGPRFNLNSCSSCHSQPTIGGSGPSINPEASVISSGIASSTTNTLPQFISQAGPTVEARFPFFFNSNGTPNTNQPDGSVQDLFTVSGLAGATACNIQQPAFLNAQLENNVQFRIPTPLFGLGLVENLNDTVLLTNLKAQIAKNFGISGAFNHNGNDGTITRFGWKAQNVSLELFAGEAYNVEMGITNEIFPQERPLSTEDLVSGLPAGCINLSKQGYPEDATNVNSTTPPTSIPSDLVEFAMFMRFLAPLPPSTTVPGGASSISSGSALFNQIGCGSCHTSTLGPTQMSVFGGGTTSNPPASLNQVTFNPYSDFAVHNMGVTLQDNIQQGGAGGAQFRSAPLWGLGQRYFLFHDGRTTDLLTAIADHASSGSEANTVVANFNALTVTQKQNILNFLRSL